MSKNYTTVFFLETVIMLYLMRFCLPNNMLLCTLLLNYCSFSPCVTLLIDHCGRRSRDRMVVGFTTTCASSAYHHYCCDFQSCLWRGVLDITL